jgi:hypothetical protein
MHCTHFEEVHFMVRSNRNLRIPIVTLGIALFVSFAAFQLALAPYHQPPPPPPPPQQSQSSPAVLLAATINRSQETEALAASTPDTALGAGVFLFDPNTNTLKFALAYSGLSGPALAAHFHNAPEGTSGPVMQTICGGPDELVGPCPTVNSGFLQGTWTVPADKVEALLNGQVYVNLHTALNPGGEIRGQITVKK